MPGTSYRTGCFVIILKAKILSAYIYPGIPYTYQYTGAMEEMEEMNLFRIVAVFVIVVFFVKIVG